jgi:hypothetical protein
VHRSRQIEKKLKNVESMPVPQGITLLAEAESSVEDDEPTEISN